MRDGSHGGATSRQEKQRLFAEAVALLDPHARQALDEIDADLLLGTGEISATGVRRSATAGLYSVPGAGKVLFQAASANLNPWTEDKVDTKNPERGPMLILAGENDHTVPHALANASFKQERRNDGVTEIVEIEGRGHSLTIDSGWREVCDKALAFVKRFI